MTAYRVIYPDGAQIPGKVDWPGDPGYDLIARLIRPILDGGNLEHVSVLHEGRRHDLFVDEDGHSKRLARNDEATAIYRCNWLTQHPECDPESLPCIVGPAILFSRLVWF